MYIAPTFISFLFITESTFLVKKYLMRQFIFLVVCPLLLYLPSTT